MKINHKRLINISIILAPTLIFGQTATLDEISIIEKKELKTNSMNIDLDKAEQDQANSFKELFKNNSSIEIGGGAINVQRLYLRGIESSNLNITLDGAKQGKNMFQHRSNELGVNPDILKIVDIKTSPDASKSGALGGSIEMTTKDAQDFVKGNKKYGAIFKSGYNTNADIKQGSATAYQVFNENIGAYININGLNGEDYKDGNNNKEIGTAYKNRDYLFKISMLNVKDHNLRFTINQNENSGNTRWRGTEYRPLPNELEKIVSTTTNYALSHNYNPNNLINLDTDLNITDITLKRDEPKANNGSRLDGNRKYENRNIGLKVQNHFDFDIYSSVNRVTIGSELQKENGKGSYYLNDLVPFDKNITTYSDIDTQNLAFFIQNRTQINNLGIDYGLRFDNYDYKTGLGKEKDNTLSPNIGIDYAITPNSLIYTNYGKSSRMTGLIPFTWVLNTKKGSTYSKDLKAEKSDKYEIGYKYEKRDIFLDDDYITFNTNLFKTKIKDLIVSKDTNCNAKGVCGSGEGGRTLQDIYNRDNYFESKGFELRIAYAYNIFQTSFGYTYIDTNNTNSDVGNVVEINEDQNIRRVGGYDSRKFVLNTRVEITKDLALDYTLNAVAGTNVLDSNNKEIRRAGYTTHDVNVKYKINSDWTLFAGVNNLTNKQYATATTISTKNQADIYRYEMGRDYRFAIKYEF